MGKSEEEIGAALDASEKWRTRNFIANI
jgi:hypothetical protein